MQKWQEISTSSSTTPGHEPGVGTFGLMSRRYPKKRGRGAARDAARRLRELYHRDDEDPASPHWGDAESGLGDDRRRGRPEAARAPQDEPAAPQLAAGVAQAHGRVVGIASGRCLVEAGGEIYDAFLPSRLAAEQRERLAVGDRVVLASAEDGAWWLRSVAPRSTELSRPDPHNPRRRRVLAANVDVVVHVTSIKKPPLVPALIDRFRIVIAESGAEPLVAINKIDLASPSIAPGLLRHSVDPSQGPVDEEIARLEPYRQLGMRIVLCTAKSAAGTAELRALLAGKTAVLAGHSGVGKSSLVNALAGRDLAETGNVAGRGKGRHTTTRAALVHLPGVAGRGDIALIDTPGIRELGLWHLDSSELERHFTDIAGLAVGCKFRDCSHSHEPGCAVRRAAAAGGLDAERLDTYHRIRASLGGAGG